MAANAMHQAAAGLHQAMGVFVQSVEQATEAAPAAQQAQALADVKRELVQLREQQAAQTAAQTAQTAQLSAKIDGLAQQLAAGLLTLQQMVSQTCNHRAGLFDPITPRVGPNGGIPANLPETPADLGSMTDASLDPLLTFYGLPVDGSTRNKKRRLAQHLGVTVHVE